jgi:glycosyltransferase involved in cell wall biosynthesis
VTVPTLLSVNSYAYRRDGSGTLFLEHNRLFGARGWTVVPFAMHHPDNIESPWSQYFVDEIEFGNSYSVAQKLTRVPKVIYSLEARRKLRRLLSDVRPDIAHLHTIYHHISPSILGLLQAHEIPTCMTLHDLKLGCPAYLMYSHGEICERCNHGGLRNVIARRCIKGSGALSALVAVEAIVHRALKSYSRDVDLFVSPSQFYIDKLVSWGWPREKFVHIRNFVDARSYSPEYAPGNSFLYVGRLAPEKGLLTLLAAAAQAKVPVRIVGVGPQLEQLRELAAKLGAEATFLGRLSGSALHDEFRACRATVLPSEWYENAPMSILESYALGKPVIAAAIGGIPEMITNGSTGWTFHSRSAEQLAGLLRKVAAVPDYTLIEAGRSARRLVETQYSADIYADNVARLYARLNSRLITGEVNAHGPGESDEPLQARGDSSRISV